MECVPRVHRCAAWGGVPGVFLCQEREGLLMLACSPSWAAEPQMMSLARGVRFRQLTSRRGDSATERAWAGHPLWGSGGGQGLRTCRWHWRDESQATERCRACGGVGICRSTARAWTRADGK